MADFRLRDLGAALEPVWRPTRARDLIRRVRWLDGWQGDGPLSLRALDRTTGKTSFRDSLESLGDGWPWSLRQAYESLDFPVGRGLTELPGEAVSLRRASERVLGGDVVRLRFLSQNTYLLQGLQIPLDRWIDDAVGWDALAWFGLPWGGALLVALNLTSVANLAIAEILALFGWTPSKVIRFLTGIDLGGIKLGAKPALEDRASEFGPALSGYDVCCLCEVWTEDSRHRIFEGLDRHLWRSAVGPDGLDDWTLTGSGLFFLSKLPIVRTETMVFSNLGVRNRDSDAWSKKGVMLNVLDLGFGHLELFQTHLYYGGGIRDKAPGPLKVALADPTPEDRRGVWSAELGELADFVRRHHRPENVALVTGDFNIRGGDAREYKMLRRAMDPLDLHDLWAWDVYGNNPSEGLTCRYTDEEPLVRTFDAECRYQPYPPAGDAAQICDDRFEEFHSPVPPSGVGRFDFLFAERPKREHRYTLEVSRALRRPFRRARITDGEPFLSDHLGLDATLFLRPR